MKFKNLESGHIKLYKRENSQYWQMKIKLPKQKAIRSSTGSKILKISTLTVFLLKKIFLIQKSFINNV